MTDASDAYDRLVQVRSTGAVKRGRAVPRVGAIWTGAFPDQDGSESA